MTAARLTVQPAPAPAASLPGSRAAAYREHNNTDRSNAFCHCAIGVNHGNLPFDIRVAVLAHQLAGIAQTAALRFEDLHGDVMVRVIDGPRGTHGRIARVLRRYSARICSSDDREGRGVLIPAAVFNG